MCNVNCITQGISLVFRNHFVPKKNGADVYITDLKFCQKQHIIKRHRDRKRESERINWPCTVQCALRSQCIWRAVFISNIDIWVENSAMQKKK